jgi:hypothetical protein
MPTVDQLVGRVLEIAQVSGPEVPMRVLMASDAHLAAFPTAQVVSERARLLALLETQLGVPGTEAMERVIVAIKTGASAPRGGCLGGPKGLSAKDYATRLHRNAR